MARLKLSNANDVAKCAEGLLSLEQVRSVEIEALVDTGATTLAIPEDVAKVLGTRRLKSRKARLADGSVIEFGVAADINLIVLEREMTLDVLVIPEGSTPLLGQIPLEALDLIVDPKSHDVAVNPASPDTPLLDLLSVA